jgi:hypothetical protein
MPDPFESSRRKVARAKEHIADLEREWVTFLATGPCSPFVEPDPNEPKHQLHKLRFSKPLPDSFANLTKEAVQHLRGALDNVGYGLAVSAGKASPRHTAFPFAGSAVEFDNAIKGRSKDIPEEICAIFRAYRPYRGGNDFLWALNEVAITDKHKLLNIAIASELGNVSGSGALVRMHVNPVWDGIKQEIELLSSATGHAVKYHIEFTLFIAFDEIAVVGGEPVLEILRYFVKIVEEIFVSLETEARRIGLVK